MTLGDVGSWRTGLQGSGIEVLAAGSPVDLAVAPATLARAAVDTGAGMVILEGRGSAADPRSNGYEVTRFLVRPRNEEPQVFIPLDRSRRAAAYAVEHWAAPETRSKQARNKLARALLQAGLFPRLPSTVTVAAKQPGLPYVAAGALDLGVEPDCDWFLTVDRRTPLSRNVFYLFPRRAAFPEWVLKFARVPGYEGPFRRDEQGLNLARDAASTAKHAPRLVGRFQVEGLHASLETAAVGTRLRMLLVRPGPEREKLQLIDDVASWLVDVARETATPPETLQKERRRLVERVVQPSAELGVPPDIVDSLPLVPGVLQHADMGCDHVLVERAKGFTVVDWECARRPGLPLRDLIQFLTDALTVLDGSPGVEHAMRLFRGELPQSPVLFRWIRVAADALRVPDEAVGPIATLLWLETALGRAGRADEVERFAPESVSRGWLAAEIASHWIRDPALGTTWSRWRGS